MEYIAEKYYKKTHKGKYGGDGLGELILKACGLVDMLTHGRIADIGFDNLTGFQQNMVKRAVCLMVDHFTDESKAVDFESFSMPDIRVTRYRRKEKPWDVAGCGKWAWCALMSTGLMRGVL